MFQVGRVLLPDGSQTNEPSPVPDGAAAVTFTARISEYEQTGERVTLVTASGDQVSGVVEIVADLPIAPNVSADAQVVVDEVWTCKLKEGKKIEDVHTANAEWVKHMNSALDVGEIKSGTVSPIVGEQDHFLFVDTYPSLEAWATADEYQSSDAGEAAMKAVQEGLDAASDCTSNRLYKFTPN